MIGSFLSAIAWILLIMIFAWIFYYCYGVSIHFSLVPKPVLNGQSVGKSDLSRKGSGTGSRTVNCSLNLEAVKV